MCGICGFITGSMITPPDVQMVRRMNAAMVHRGPDGKGEYADDNVVMAMRRLSIIDLTGGWQPLYNENRSVVLMANGEIYNYVELRQKLRARGHIFETGSDCETILHLYEDFGLDGVHYLRGMFAFALWDRNKKKIILCRDRMGEKPLYIHEGEKAILFSSEMKSLLNSGRVPFELDPESVHLYFHYHYVPEPKTPLKNVRKLPAAHQLIIDTDDWKLDEKCYWMMEDAPPIEGDPGKIIGEELDKVSELVIRSDVPVGVALSGGLDSSAIAALAVKKYPGTMHAFSVGYEGRPPNDEREDAKKLAEALGMPFHEIEVSTEDVVSFFPELVYWQDDPIADIAGYGYYAVNRLAKEHNVPVMLQGQGGDELFWGYPWMRRGIRESIKKEDMLKNGLLSIIKYLSFKLPQKIDGENIIKWVQNWGGIRSDIYDLLLQRKNPNRLRFYDFAPEYFSALKLMPQYYGAYLIDHLNDRHPSDLFSFPHPWPPLDILMTRLVIETYLRENGIAQGDRLSMASSVELRLPLVDYSFIEIIIGLRKSQHDFHLQPKAWLKSFLKDILPEWAINRSKKGFTPPVRNWIHSVLKKYGKKLKNGFLLSSGILNERYEKRFSEILGYENNKAPGNISIDYKALVLEMWCESLSARCDPNSHTKSIALQ